MKIFRVTFRTHSGEVRSERHEADSVEEIESNRKEGGPRVLAINELPDEPCRATLKEFGAFLKRFQALCSRQVAISFILSMIAAELPDCSFRLCLERVQTDIEHGRSFADALARHPNVFPSPFVETSRALKTRSNLSAVVGDLVELFRRLHPEIPI